MAKSLSSHLRCSFSNGFEEFVARDGGGAAFHDHQAAGDVGNMRGFEGRGASWPEPRV